MTTAAVDDSNFTYRMWCTCSIPWYTCTCLEGTCTTLHHSLCRRKDSILPGSCRHTGMMRRIRNQLLGENRGDRQKRLQSRINIPVKCQLTAAARSFIGHFLLLLLRSFPWIVPVWGYWSIIIAAAIERFIPRGLSSANQSAVRIILYNYVLSSLALAHERKCRVQNSEFVRDLFV